MILFRYRAFDKDSGMVMPGLSAAPTVKDFEEWAKRNNLQIIKQKKTKSKDRLAKLKNDALSFFKNVEVFLFNKISLIDAISIQINSIGDTTFKSILEYALFRIKSGDSLSNVLKNYPLLFDGITIKIIEVGEKTATIDKSFKYIVQYLENKDTFKKQIKGLLRYPVILLFVILTVFVFWVAFVVPSFVDCFDGLGVEIPAMTRAMLSIRSFFVSHYVFILLSIGLIVSYAFILFKTNILSVQKRYLLEKAPIFGSILKSFKKLDFYNSMHILLLENVSLISAMECSSSIFKDSSLAVSMNRVSYSLKRGDTMRQAFSESGLMDDFEINILSSGESSASLPMVFKILMMSLDSKLKYTIKKITSISEPLIIIILGSFVLSIVYSVLLPLYNNLDLS